MSQSPSSRDPPTQHAYAYVSNLPEPTDENATYDLLCAVTRSHIVSNQQSSIIGKQKITHTFVASLPREKFKKEILKSLFRPAYSHEGSCGDRRTTHDHMLLIKTNQPLPFAQRPRIQYSKIFSYAKIAREPL